MPDGISSMKVLDFNINKGLFHFEISDLNAKHHTHPTFEIVQALTGGFSLETDTTRHDHLNFAIIEANIPHKIVSREAHINLLMIESHNELLSVFLSENNLAPINGLFVGSKSVSGMDTIGMIKAFALQNDLKTVQEKRVEQCMRLIEADSPVYGELIPRITASVFLSESRISHLFKEHVGISLKKYLVWSRLKRAVNFLINEGASFTEASYESGFYDQAHLSNAFKQFMGMNPSKPYNSRTLQF